MEAIFFWRASARERIAQSSIGCVIMREMSERWHSARPGTITRALRLVGQGTRRRSGKHLWSPTPRGDRGTPWGASPRRWRQDAGRAVVSRCDASTSRKTCCAGATTRRRSCSGAREQSPRSMSSQKSTTSSIAHCTRRLRGRRRRRRSRRGLHAEHARRRSSSCSRRRASAPSGRRARRTSACRACSTASARSSPKCCLSRTAITTAASDRHAAAHCGSARSSCLAQARRRRTVYARASRHSAIPSAMHWPISSGLLRGKDIAVRTAAVQPSALHHVFLRHDRRAEMHRARRRRHAAAAPRRSTGCTPT